VKGNCLRVPRRRISQKGRVAECSRHYVALRSSASPLGQSVFDKAERFHPAPHEVILDKCQDDQDSTKVPGRPTFAARAAYFSHAI